MMFRLIVLLVLAAVPAVVPGAVLPAAAQLFAEQAAPFGPAVWSSTLAPADVDGDGDLDVLVTGIEPGGVRSTVRLYRNDSLDASGAVRFAEVGASFPDLHLYLSSLLSRLRAPTTRWGDLDGDGDLDLLVANGDAVGVYRHDSTFAFTPIYTDVPLREVRDSTLITEALNTPSAAWGDFDGDGDLDALVARRTGTHVLRNDDALFTPLPVGLPSLANASVAWGDLEGDGDLDVLAVQRLHGGRSLTAIYRNDGGLYVRHPAELPAFEQGSATWGDADGDGDLDVLVTGGSLTAATLPGSEVPGATAFFRNDDGLFVRTADVLPAAWYGRWLDADADDDLDLLLLSGDAAGNSHFRIVRNDGGRFTAAAETLPGVWLGAAAVGDLTGDGRVDVLMTGQIRTGLLKAPGTLLYANRGPVAVAPGPVPTGLEATREGPTIRFGWTAPVDSLRPALTFNVRVGTAPGADDVVAGHALASGQRRIVGPGNAGHRQHLTIADLDTSETYYWSVQTLGATGVGSAFADEQTVRPETSRPTLGPRPRRLPDIIDNFPNPFNPTTTVRFALDAPTDVRVVVYNVLGAEIGVLAQGRFDAGVHEAAWNGRDRAGREVPSGVYLCVLDAGGQRASRSMLLLK